MARIKFSDIVTVCRQTRTTEGLLSRTPNGWTGDADGNPLYPNRDLEAVCIYGMYSDLGNAAAEFQLGYGVRPQWARDGIGNYLKFDIERVEF